MREVSRDRDSDLTEEGREGNRVNPPSPNNLQVGFNPIISVRHGIND